MPTIELYKSLTHKIRENSFDFFQFDNIKTVLNNPLESFNQYTHIVIIGMGASLLNVKAICSIAKQTSKTITYLGSLHKQKIDEELSKINLSKTVVFSISKSGNTHETTVITEYVIQTNLINRNNIYIISPNNNNLLFNLSRTYNLKHIEHGVIGSGRFNIISSSTLLPAMHFGINVDKIISGAKKALNTFLEDGTATLTKARWYADNYNLNRNILVMFNYSYSLFGFLQWKHQMLAESLGKNGFGITPIIANGTFDEHSQLQLYLDGPDNKFYEVILQNDVENTILSNALNLHSKNVYQTFVSHNKEVNLETIQAADEETIASLIIDTILIIMIIAMDKNINPFNQPSVDSCKMLRQNRI